MADEELGSMAVRIGLDSTGFATGITGINRELKVLDSAFKANTAALGENGKGIEALRLKAEKLSSQEELQKKKVNALKEAYDKSVLAKGADAKATQELEIKLNLANAALSRTQVALVGTNREIAIQSSGWTTLGSSLTDVSDKMKSTGEKMGEIGADLTTKLTIPIVGIGVASGKMAIDFGDSMAKVSTISDETQVPIAELGDAVLQLSSETGISANEIANNIYDAISAGQSTGEAVNFVTNSTKLAKAGFAEAGDSLDLLTTILNSYGLKSSEVNKVSDILIQTQNRGKVTVGELSSTMGKIIPTANALGVNLEQVAAGFALMTIKGIKSAETTSYMNAMFNEMGKSGSTAFVAIDKATGKTFPELIKSGKSVSDVLALMETYAKKNGLSLKDMFGSSEAGTAALVLATDGGKAFNTELEQMGKSAGATDAAFEKVSSTSGQKLQRTINDLKNSAIKLGESIVPIAEKIADVVEKVTDSFNELTPAQQENIVKIGLVVAAMGPLLSIGGKLLTVGGGVIGVAGRFATSLGLATVAAEGATVAVAGTGAAVGTAGTGAAAAALLFNPLTLAVIGVGAAGLGAALLLNQKVIPAVNLFGREVSAATKKSVTAYMDLDQKAEVSLLSFQANHTVITAAIAKDMTTTFETMGAQIKAGRDKHYTEDLTNLTKFYTDQGTINSADAQDVLTKMKATHATNNIEEDKSLKEIAAIVALAVVEKRKLKQAELDEIARIEKKMKGEAITALSSSVDEQKIIFERAKLQATGIATLQASEVIKQSASQRDKTIKAANDEYKGVVDAIARQRAEGVPISDDEARKTIAAAEVKRAGALGKAEDMHRQVVDELGRQNAEVLTKLNAGNGDVKDNWDSLRGWFAKHPIVTNVISQVSQSLGGRAFRPQIDMKAAGDNNFRGGLTTMHEKGYEVYNLPGGSKIYNHEASQDMVLKTAQEVARSVMGGMQTQSQPAESSQPIQINLHMDGKVISQQLFRINQGRLQSLGVQT